MAPHSMETILRPPQWPLGLSNFVTWCLMWDPKSRPTTAQALQHEYFADAADPLRPKSSRLLSKKHSNGDSKYRKDSIESPPLSSKSSWFRKSFVGKDSGPAVPTHSTKTQVASPRPSPIHATTGPPQMSMVSDPNMTIKARPFANKRATWTNGTIPANAAPMPILPSIRPISPFSATITAQAYNSNNETSNTNPQNQPVEAQPSKKIGRQLSVASHGNHYADYHRQEAERALNGNRDVTSPNGTQKEGFFSHLRKRARRLSGRPQVPMSPTPDDIEANAGCAPWQNNRSSMAVDSSIMMDAVMKKNVAEVDKSLQSARHNAEASPPPINAQPPMQQIYPTNSITLGLKRHSSVSSQHARPAENGMNVGLISNRTRRALQLSTHPSNRYETPDEEDELLHEALGGAAKAAKGLQTPKSMKSYQNTTPPLAASEREPIPQPPESSATTLNPYPTPSSSAKRNSVKFDHYSPTEQISPLSIAKTRPKEDVQPRWPTPPSEGNEWAASAAASIFAAGSLQY